GAAQVAQDGERRAFEGLWDAGAESTRGHGRSLAEGHTDGAGRLDGPGRPDRRHVRAATGGGHPMIIERLCGGLVLMLSECFKRGDGSSYGFDLPGVISISIHV